MKRKTKNLILGLIVLLITALVCGCIYFLGKKINENDNKMSHVVELNIDTLKEKVENKDNFILVITQTGCSHCEAFLPVVNKVGEKYDITFYQLNRAKMDGDGIKYLKEVVNINTTAPGFGTPTTFFIYDGVEKTIVNRLVGEKTESKLIERLISEGYINEN